jgi:hypothetical protein
VTYNKNALPISKTLRYFLAGTNSNLYFVLRYWRSVIVEWSENDSFRSRVVICLVLNRCENECIHIEIRRWWRIASHKKTMG